MEDRGWPTCWPDEPIATFGGETVQKHIATYREIAAHWGLAGVDVARVKAKRARWRQLPRNHPADPVRVAIPRAAWDIAVMNGGGASGLRGEVTTPSSKSDARPPSGKFSSRDKEVARALAILHELRDQVRVAQERAARAEAAAAAERVRAQEATTEAATAMAEAESIRMERDRITTERDRMRIELEAWTAGGPLARAWRAFLNRR